MTVLRGDCVEVMAGMSADSVDAIVCDPPYDLVIGRTLKLGPMKPQHAGSAERRINGGFMGKEWDGTGVAFRPETWAAALRVAKPGAYLLAFGGTRTVHRMTCALEDAGWVVRDMLVWAYASGFPKSRASLKPAWEPIVLCRKPGRSVDLNIDAARIGTEGGAPAPREGGASTGVLGDGLNGGWGTPVPGLGRWPANVILTDPIFDGGWEGVVGGGESNPERSTRVRHNRVGAGAHGIYGEHEAVASRGHGDTGTYSRFFLVPKAPTRERVLSDGRRSPHPTQKPEALIRHLVTLVTPPGGLVLDPFLGSGTLGVVCDGLGVRWLGIEREAEYADWAEDRIADGRPLWEVPA
jgi:site-specific DNA-methyltransferase (adenine-specific)